LLRMVQENCKDQNKILESVFGRIINAADITKSGLGENGLSRVDHGEIFSLNYEEYETSKRELLSAIVKIGTV